MRDAHQNKLDPIVAPVRNACTPCTFSSIWRCPLLVGQQTTTILIIFNDSISFASFASFIVENGNSSRPETWNSVFSLSLKLSLQIYLFNVCLLVGHRHRQRTVYFAVVSTSRRIEFLCSFASNSSFLSRNSPFGIAFHLVWVQINLSSLFFAVSWQFSSVSFHTGGCWFVSFSPSEGWTSPPIEVPSFACSRGRMSMQFE